MLLEAHLQTLNKPAAKLNSSEFQNSKTNLDEAQSNLKAELTSKKREYQRINWCRTVDQQHKIWLDVDILQCFLQDHRFRHKGNCEIRKY